MKDEIWHKFGIYIRRRLPRRINLNPHLRYGRTYSLLKTLRKNRPPLRRPQSKPWELVPGSLQRPIAVAVQAKPSQELVIHLPGSLTWVQLEKEDAVDQWSVGIAGNDSKEWGDAVSKLQQLMREIRFALDILPGDMSCSQPKLEGSTIFFNRKRFTKKSVAEKYYEGQEISYSCGGNVVLQSRTPIALNALGLNRLASVPLSDFKVGYLVDVGFMVKVFKYDKTFIKFDLAELVLLQASPRMETPRVDMKPALRRANAEEEEQGFSDSDDSDMNMHI